VSERSGRLVEGYRTTAVVLLNFAVLLVVFNLLLWAGFAVRDGALAPGRPASDALFLDDGTPVDTGDRTEYQLDWFDFNAYGENADYVAAVLDGFYRLEREGFIYQPWVQFAEPPVSTPLVNIQVDERGFPTRRTAGQDEEDERGVIRIFTLGGSTTMGEQVSDEHTWPSQLSQLLNERAREDGFPYRIEVVNYGRAYYFPGQQSMLLQDLLKAGHRPSLVIFMDGVNWGGVREQPQLTPEIARAFVERQHGRRIAAVDALAAQDWVPMIRLARAVRRGMLGSPDEDGVASANGDGEDRFVRTVVNRFEQSAAIAAATCELYGCRISFYLQPHALYRYNHALYRRELPSEFLQSIPRVADFYRRMAHSEYYQDLSHLFEEFGPERKAVIDDLHYSPAFGRFLARTVAERIDLADLPWVDPILDVSAATGLPRSMITREGRIVPR
jgi:hypothetical protein